MKRERVRPPVVTYPYAVDWASLGAPRGQPQGALPLSQTTRLIGRVLRGPSRWTCQPPEGGSHADRD